MDQSLNCWNVDTSLIIKIEERNLTVKLLIFTNDYIIHLLKIISFEDNTINDKSKLRKNQNLQNADNKKVMFF